MLHQFGIFDEVSESVDWFTEVLEVTMEEEEKPSKQMVEGSKTVLLSFGMALVQKMLENGIIALIADGEFEEDEF